MTALTSPSTWRTHPHRIDGYLSVDAPDVIFACQVNQEGGFSTYPIVAIPYDNVSEGAYTDVEIGMTVRFSTSGGSFVGYGRVRLAATSDTLYVGAIPSGDMILEDDDTIEVLDDYRLFARIPKIDATNPIAVTFYKDYNLAYTNQGTYPPPVSNIGPHVAGFVGDDDYLHVEFLGATNSYAMTNGVSISSYSNDIGDGTYVTGNSSSGDFVAKFPPGRRWVKLTVTDSNGKTHTSRRYIRAHERTGTHAPMRADLAALTTTLDQGPIASFTVLEDDAGQDVIPVGSLVLYFEVETYGSASGSINSHDYDNLAAAYRSVVAGTKFVGWTTQNSEKVSSRSGSRMDDMLLTATGPSGIMATLPSFSQSVQNATSPNTWYKMANLTLWRFMWYMLAWHTTALEVCDLARPSWYASYPYHKLDVDEGNVLGVMNVLAGYINARLACDLRGNLFVNRDPQMMTDEDRDDVDTTLSLTSSDYEELAVVELDRDTEYWVRGSGLKATTSAVTPYLSIAPGKSPGQGGIQSTLDHQLVEDQTDLNVRTGRRYGVKNTKYPPFPITIINAGLVADPAWREWLQLDLPAAYTKRGSMFADRLLLRDMTYSFDAEVGAAKEVWTVEPETFGTPGETILIPNAKVEDMDYVGRPKHRPIRWTQYDPRKRYYGSFSGCPRVYAATTARVVRSDDFFAASPTWNSVATAAMIFSGLSSPSIYYFDLDPFDNSSAYVWGYDADYFQLVYAEHLDEASSKHIFTVLTTIERIGTGYYPGVQQNDRITRPIYSWGSRGTFWFGRYSYDDDSGLTCYRRVGYSGSVEMVSTICDKDDGMLVIQIGAERFNTSVYTTTLWCAYTDESKSPAWCVVERSTDGGLTWEVDTTFANPFEATRDCNGMSAELFYQYNLGGELAGFWLRAPTNAVNVRSAFMFRDSEGSYTYISDLVGWGHLYAAPGDNSTMFAIGDPFLEGELSTWYMTDDLVTAPGIDLEVSNDDAAIGLWPSEPTLLIQLGCDTGGTNGIYWTEDIFAVIVEHTDATGDFTPDGSERSVAICPVYLR